MPNRHLSSYLPAVAVSAVLTAWSGASFGQTLTIATDQPLGGDQIYQEVTIDAEVTVPAYDPTEPETGWLRIYADRIVIGDTGSINADGAGFNAASLGPGPGGFNRPGNDNQPSPGGGGAHVGAGASGAWGEAPMMCPNQNGSLCQLYAAAPGGIPYEDALNPLALGSDPAAGMGSAGGRSSAGCPNNTSELPGGAGGGVILLYANQIDLRGVLLARGATPSPGALTSPGGGAGGTIILSASNTLSLGAGAELRVDGANGVQGNAVGGAGGGGLIVLASTSDVSAALMTNCPATTACTSVTGGSTAPCLEPAGEGTRLSRAPLACPDADGDGVANFGCIDPLATDCNDADPDVNPDATEICDGVDNDCDGGIDENPDELCDGPSLTCVDGDCAPVVGGSGGGISTPTPDPPRVKLSGALCSVRGPLGQGPLGQGPLGQGPLGQGPLGQVRAWLAALLLVGSAARRRRAPR